MDWDTVGENDRVGEIECVGCWTTAGRVHDTESQGVSVFSCCPSRIRGVWRPRSIASRIGMWRRCSFRRANLDMAKKHGGSKDD